MTCPAFVIRFLSVYLGTRVRNHLTYSRCVNVSIPLCAWMRMFCTKPIVMKWLAPCAWGPCLSLSCHRVHASWRQSLWIHGWVKVLSTFHYSPLLLSHTSCLSPEGEVCCQWLLPLAGKQLFLSGNLYYLYMIVWRKERFTSGWSLKQYQFVMNIFLVVIFPLNMPHCASMSCFQYNHRVLHTSVISAKLLYLTLSIKL